jgi:hypothetical protein
MPVSPVSLSKKAKEQLLDPATIGGFLNFREMATGKELVPRGFCPQKYQAVLRSLAPREEWYMKQAQGWQPTAESLLGGLHFLYCLDQLSQRFKKSTGGNENRRSPLLIISQRIQQGAIAEFRNSDHAIDTDWAEEVLWGPGRSDSYDTSLVEFSGLELNSVCALLALNCRKQARDGKSLNMLLMKIKKQFELSDEQFVMALSYLLYVADELFHFYLMYSEVYLLAQE